MVLTTTRTELLSLDKTAYLRFIEAAMRAGERGGGGGGGSGGEAGAYTRPLFSST
jgi:hypothetical protein